MGPAQAEREARKVLVEQAEGPQISSEEIERRIQHNLDKRFLNLAAIVLKARLALPDGDVPDVEPDVGWTSAFSEAAQGVSSDEMQDLWARVLAGEVATPGSTGIRTLNTLRNLDTSAAWLFRRLCSIAVYIPMPEGTYLDYRAPSLSKDGAYTSLGAYGLSYGKLNDLNEHGLIIAEYNSWCDYRVCIAGQLPRIRDRSTGALRFTYQGQQWGLLSEGERYLNQEFRVNGVALTKVGRELARVVDQESVPQYDKALKEFFQDNGLAMARRVGMYLEPIA